MNLNKIFKSGVFFSVVVCISFIYMITNSTGKVLHDPFCQGSEYFFTQGVIKAGQNSFTASQIKNYLIRNGFKNIKQLRLDDKGVWRALIEFNNCYFLISIDYSGTIDIQDKRKKYD
ncbi:hypothetical protein [Bartonella sp. B41]